MKIEKFEDIEAQNSHESGAGEKSQGAEERGCKGEFVELKI